MLPLMLHIMPPAPTTMARPIMVALAVMAERDGWRVMLPWASSPVPSRAKTPGHDGTEAGGEGPDKGRSDQHQAQQEEETPKRHQGEYPAEQPDEGHGDHRRAQGGADAAHALGRLDERRPQHLDRRDPAGGDGGQQPGEERHPDAQGDGGEDQAGLHHRAADLEAENLLIDAGDGAGDPHTRQVPKADADGGPDDALHQALGQDEPHDGAAAGADGPQHADVVPALRHDGAEGVEDDERAHEQGQHPEHVQSDRAGLQDAKDLRAGGDRVQDVGAAELTQDLLVDGLAGSGVRGGVVGLHRVDQARTCPGASAPCPA